MRHATLVTRVGISLGLLASAVACGESADDGGGTGSGLGADGGTGTVVSGTGGNLAAGGAASGGYFSATGGVGLVGSGSAGSIPGVGGIVGAGGGAVVITPPSCGDASPTLDGLEFWIKASDGPQLTDGRVESWTDLSGNESITQDDAGLRPQVEAGALNSKAVVHFSNTDTLHRNLPINGLTGLTIATVSATPVLWKAGNEWCQDTGCSSDNPNGLGRPVAETGCSGSYQAVIGWKGYGDNGGVSLSPKQEEVAYRIGVGVTNYHDDTCMRDFDPWISTPRPSSRGDGFSVDVLVHDQTQNRIYENGVKILEVDKQIPGGSSAPATAIANTTDQLNIGAEPGWANRSSDGQRIAEILIYTRALSDAERVTLEQYLNCEYFPERVSGQ